MKYLLERYQRFKKKKTQTKPNQTKPRKNKTTKNPTPIKPNLPILLPFRRHNSLQKALHGTGT